MFSCRRGCAVVKKGTLKSCLPMVHLSNAHLSPWWWYPLWRTKEEMWKPVGQYIQPNPPVTQQDGEGPGFYSHLGQVKWLDSVDVEFFSCIFNQCQRIKKMSKHFHELIILCIVIYVDTAIYYNFLLLWKKHSCWKFRKMSTSEKNFRIDIIYFNFSPKFRSVIICTLNKEI